MDAYQQELHIEDELFAGMRTDTDRVMQKLLKNMVEKDSMEGKVTITLDVTLMQEFIPNRDPNIEGETRRVLTPMFSHKVGSVMKITNEAKGDRNCDGCELVYDVESKEYVLRPIVNTEQMSIFDADFKCVNDPEKEEFCNEPERTALECMEMAALPGPVSESEDDEEEDISREFDEDEPLPFSEENDSDYEYDNPEEF